MSEEALKVMFEEKQGRLETEPWMTTGRENVTAPY